MTISEFTLFIACLLFSGFSFYVNTKVHDQLWLKVTTLLYGVLGMVAAIIVLTAVFMRHIQ
jgi:hypothetical protein